MTSVTIIELAATDTDRRPGRERWPGLTDTKGTT